MASLGTAFTTQQSSILKRYTNEVLLTYDSDEAGVKAALRAIPILREAGLTARIIHMEPYKDPDEFLKAEGAERFQERMDQAESSFSFELGVLERQYDMGEPQSRTAFFRALSGTLLEFEQASRGTAIRQQRQSGTDCLRDSWRAWSGRWARRPAV